MNDERPPPGRYVMGVRVAFITHTWNWITHFFLWGSATFYLLFLLVLSVAYGYSAEYYYVAIHCVSSVLFWVVCLSCVLTVLLLDVVVEAVRLEFMPGLVDIGREIDNDVFVSRQVGPRASACVSACISACVHTSLRACVQLCVRASTCVPASVWISNGRRVTGMRNE
jgi:hypothetical protein